MRTHVAARRPRVVDTPAYLSMLDRMIRSAGVRVADAGPSELAQLDRLRGALDDALAEAVAGIRGSGYTWQEIGDAMGTTRQAPIMRWVRRA